jgi:transmembrane sensor
MRAMSESRLSYLFSVYFNKAATPPERNELMKMLNSSENDEHIKTLMTEAWLKFNTGQQIFSDNTGDEILSNILQKEITSATTPVIELNNRQYFVKWMQIAAAAILIAGITGLGFWLLSKQSLQQISQSKKDIPQVVSPVIAGGNKALLTLSDGSSIVLDSSRQGTLAKQGNVKVVRLNTATLAYRGGVANNQEVVYNTLSTPAGGQYGLILPDGSKVWLNAASSIHFPTVFNGKERNVTVTGEAYFEVAKNAALPFKITVKDIVVEVLGTHFNIMAYDDENSMNTTLLEGSVKVSKGGINKMLVPGQQSFINAAGVINIKEADIEEVMAWRNGWFQFNAFDIKMVMRQISRWYNLEVVYEGKIPPGHFTGSVSRSNNILDVLKILESGGVRFKIEGHKITVLS